MKIWPIAFVIITGCASQIENPAKSPVTLVQRQSRSEAVVIPPTPPPVTRVPQDVQLQWSPPKEPDASQVVSYNIYYGFEPDMWCASVLPVGNVTNAVVPGLVGGAQYYFAVTDLGADGGESDYSPILPHTPKLVMDILFAFDQPVTNVVLQTSTDLIQWRDFGMIPTNGTWRVTADPSSPWIFYRGMGTTTQ